MRSIRESPDTLLVKELVSDDKLEKKTVFPTVAKIEFVRPKQQEKLVRKPVKYDKTYSKACFVYGSFDHVHANYNYHQRERVVSRNNYTRVNYNYSAKKTHPSAHKNMVPRAVLMKTSLKAFNTARHVTTAHPKTIVNTAKGKFYTARPKAVNTARPNSAVVNTARANQVNVVKASACWGHLQKEDQGFVDSGCSKHMTGNMSYLSDFKEFDGGCDVYFVKELQFNLFSVSQMCDKKNSILFTNTGCFVLSPDFTLADESQVLLKVPRKNNIIGFVVMPYNKALMKMFRGDGPKWLFDIDVLTKSMNYVPVVVGTNSNDFLGTEESIGAGHSSKKSGSSQDYILMPLWKDGSLFDSSSKAASNDESQPSSDARKKNDEGICKESRIDDQERPENSTQSVNTEQDMFSLGDNATHEATHADFFGDETEVDMCNITTTYLVPSTPNTRIHKNHSLDHVIGDVQSGIDVKGAFLYGKIEEEVYVYQPSEFEDPEFPDRVYKVEKALYGLHQAPRAYNDCMSSDNLCVSNSLNVMKFRVKPKQHKSKKAIWKLTGKVFTQIGYIWRSSLPVGPSSIVDYYEKVDISHENISGQFSIANGVGEAVATELFTKTFHDTSSSRESLPPIHVVVATMNHAVINWLTFTQTTVDQDCTSPSNSPTTQETQTPILYHDVEHSAKKGSVVARGYRQEEGFSRFRRVIRSVAVISGYTNFSSHVMLIMNMVMLSKDVKTAFLNVVTLPWWRKSKWMKDKDGKLSIHHTIVDDWHPSFILLPVDLTYNLLICMLCRILPLHYQHLLVKLVVLKAEKRRYPVQEAEYNALSVCGSIPLDEINNFVKTFHFIKEHVENGVIELYFVNTEYQLADIFTKALGRERIEFLINKLGMRSFTPETLKKLADDVDE
ncbi:putative ribonuclease H-like domain-containing protein [Tanacetum coccineum]